MNKDWKIVFDKKFKERSDLGFQIRDRIKDFIQYLLDQKDKEWKDKIEDIELDEFLSDKKYNNGYNNGYKEATKEWKDKIEKAIPEKREKPRLSNQMSEVEHSMKVYNDGYNQAIEDIINNLKK